MRMNPAMSAFNSRKLVKKSDGEEPDHRPEEDLEEAEDISLRDDPILKDEGPYLNQYPLQIQ